MSGDFDFFPFTPEDGVHDLGEGRFSLPPSLIARIAVRAFGDIAFYFSPRHVARLQAAFSDREASPNDRFVLSMLLRNARAASGGKLPLCQDTGIAAVFGFKESGVVVTPGEGAALSAAVREVYAEKRLRFSTVLASSFFEEYDPGDNLPAQVMIFSVDSPSGDSPPGAAGIFTGGPPRFWDPPAYRLLFSAKGGGSSNKTRLIQGTKALVNPASFRELLKEEIAAIGTAACPPYTIAAVAGGLSPEENLLALKLAASGWYDSLPFAPSPEAPGAPFRDRELEAFMMDCGRNTGLGAGAGGRAFAVDALAVRLPRHGASFPVSVGVACSAHRTATAIITREGWWLERLLRDPPEWAPPPVPASALRVNTEKGMQAALRSLSGAPAGSLVLVSGPLLVARDAAHSRWKALLDSGSPLPDYTRRYPILYAGPAGTPPGCVCGSIGPTTAGRMDSYGELLMSHGAGLVTLAKGNRSAAWEGVCKKYGGCYLGVPGGCAALIAQENALSLETLDYPDLGMEAVRLLTVKDLPAFVMVGCGGKS
ncbi:MAG: fumarate hydratase [Spirochaetaceae bacterium]|jgi:fumarate hydratase class I|nr:fumarate hydratase [Spirochaetaceae bacterium]